MKRKIILLIFILLPILSSSANAQIRYKMTSYEGSGDATTPFFNLNLFNQEYFEISEASFTNLFQNLFDLAIGLSIALAVIMFMIGAFSGIIGDGKISVAGVKKGKERMQDSIIALMIILSSWLIINTINPDLLRLPVFSLFNRAQSQGTAAGNNAGLEVTGGLGQ